MPNALEQLQSDMKLLHQGAFDQISPVSMMVVATFLAKEKEYALLSRLKNALCEVTNEKLIPINRSISKKAVISVVVDYIAGASNFLNEELVLQRADSVLADYFEWEFKAVFVHAVHRPKTYKIGVRETVYGALPEEVYNSYLRLEALLKRTESHQRHDIFCKQKIAEALDRSGVPKADAFMASDDSAPSSFAVMAGGARHRRLAC